MAEVSLQKISTNCSKGLYRYAAEFRPQDVQTCYIADNFIFDAGYPTVREGIEKVSKYALGARIDGLYFHEGGAKLVAAAGGQLWHPGVGCSGLFEAYGSSVSGTTRFTEYSGYLLLASESSPPQYLWNASTLWPVGISSEYEVRRLAGFEKRDWVLRGSILDICRLDTDMQHATEGIRCLHLSPFGDVSGAGFGTVLFGTSGFGRGYGIEYPMSGAIVKSSRYNFLLPSWCPPISGYAPGTTASNGPIKLACDVYVDDLFCVVSSFVAVIADHSGNVVSCNLAATSAWRQTSGQRGAWIQPVWDITKGIWANSGARIEFQWTIDHPLNYSSEHATQLPEFHIYVDYLRAIYGLGVPGTPQSLPGNYSGHYQYAQTRVTADYLESDPVYGTDIAACTSGKPPTLVYRTSSPEWSQDSRVVGHNIYRRGASQPAYVFLQQHSVTSPRARGAREEAKVLDQCLADSQDATWVPTSGHNPPPQAAFICQVGGYTYMLDCVYGGVHFPNRLIWSEPYQPHYYLLHQAYDLKTRGRGIAEFQGLVYLFEESRTSIWDPTNYITITRHPGLGCIAPDTIATSEDSLMWLSSEGVIRHTCYAAYIANPHGSDFEVVSDGIREFLADATTEDKRGAKGIMFNRFYLLTLGEHTYCYHTVTKAWSRFPNLKATAWARAPLGAGNPYGLYFGTESGDIYRMFWGSLDNGDVISSTLSPALLGQESPRSRLRHGYLGVVNLDGDQKTIAIDYQPAPYQNVSTILVDASAAVPPSYRPSASRWNMPQEAHGNYHELIFRGSGRFAVRGMDLWFEQDSSLR
jgi:hypothetical protein